MKKIAEQKLQAFSLGAVGMRPLSRREVEEQKKKKEEEAAAHVFQEFVETFQETPTKAAKVWVKAGTYDAGARKEDTSERGKLYKPQSRLSDSGGRSSVEQAQELARVLGSRAPPPLLRRRGGEKDKKKSNLELFKEELQKIQEEREERHKYKGVLRTALTNAGADAATAAEAATMYSLEGSYDNGDPNTTNLYLGNLNPKITEQELMEIFGRYGPLASIKIMWPRSDEEKARGRICGFVAYMSRKDGDRAMRNINGKEVLGYEMKLGWGKAVVIPPVPIYIPAVLQQPSKPLPSSGLPFNAQPPKHLMKQIPRVRPGESYPSDPEDKALFKQILSQSIVKVIVPTERNILMLIHRMAEFVIREGPMFEAMIMNKEINNPFFRFLFENQSAVHIYYRWKLFSLLQGDAPKAWNTNDFRMFKGGSVWRPPVMNVYTAGMPDDLVEEEEPKDIRGTLSNNQRERLEELIRALTPERQGVAEAMVWCLEHAEAANEICDCIAESLSNPDTAIHKKIARIYLISDILHNCGAKLTNASAFRKAFQLRLLQIMRDASDALARQESRLQSEGFRARVTRVLQAWADWAIFPTDFLFMLNQIFLGVQEKEEEPGSPGAGSTASESESWSEEGGGGPLDGAALRRLAAAHQPASSTAASASVAVAAHAPPRAPAAVLDDIDGVPLDEDIDGVPMEAGGSEAGGSEDGEPAAPGFVPSKWESVEPADVEAGAVTTSQWERLAAAASPAPARSPSPRSPSPLPTTPADSAHDSSEAWSSRRAVLREVEVKVLKYQDELESGRRSLKPGLTQQQQLQHYRKKLIKKATREAKEKEEATADSPEARSHKSEEGKKSSHRERERRDRAASLTSEEGYTTSTSKKSKRSHKESREMSLSPPPKRSRHRSRSRERTHRRRTPSPPPAPPSRRRSPSPPPPPTTGSSSARKHKHSKHKY